VGPGGSNGWPTRPVHQPQISPVCGYHFPCPFPRTAVEAPAFGGASKQAVWWTKNSPVHLGPKVVQDRQRPRPPKYMEDRTHHQEQPFPSAPRSRASPRPRNSGGKKYGDVGPSTVWPRDRRSQVEGCHWDKSWPAPRVKPRPAPRSATTWALLR